MPSEANEGSDDYEMMPSLHRVIEYSKLDYNSVLSLPHDVFLMMLKHSVIDELNSTEEGREYLEKCKRLNTTSLDIKAFRKKKIG